MDLQVKSDYPNIRILLDIIEMLEDFGIMGCRYDLRIATDKENKMSLYVGITPNRSPVLSRQIHYSTNDRPELERLSYDIQVLLCSEQKAHTKNNQHQESTLP